MTRRRRLAALGLALLLGVGLSASAHAADEEVRTIPARPGVTESFLLLRPEGAPVGSIVGIAVAVLAAIDIVTAVIFRRPDPDGRPRWRWGRTRT